MCIRSALGPLQGWHVHPRDIDSQSVHHSIGMICQQDDSQFVVLETIDCRGEARRAAGMLDKLMPVIRVDEPAEAVVKRVGRSVFCLGGSPDELPALLFE